MSIMSATVKQKATPERSRSRGRSSGSRSTRYGFGRRGFAQYRWAILAVLLVLAVPALAEACPTCKEGLAASDPKAESLVRGYFWSILFMMSMPFLILFSLVTYFWLLVRKARKLAPNAPSTLPAT